MKLFKRLLVLCVLGAVLMSNAFAIGAQLRQFSLTSDTTVSEFLDGLNWLDPQNGNLQSEKYKNIVDTVVNNYYYGTSAEQLTEAILNGTLLRVPQKNIEYIYMLMFSSLDIFSNYTPAAYNSLYEEPHYTGYGIVIHDSNNDKYTDYEKGLYIEEVYADSPAAKAGILPHDKVVAVNGIYVENLSINAMTTLMSSYGDDQECTLKVNRNGRLMEFTMKKESILTSELMTFFYPRYSTARFQITSFSAANLPELFEAAVKQTHELGYRNIIIDLRDNPGGVVDYAMNTTDTLITQDHRLFTFLSKGEQPFMEYDSDFEGYTFPNVYVLVNPNTASAAEAMTISLKSLGNAVVVGEKTFGKEIGQIIFEAKDKSTFAVTSFKGFGPNGEDYNTVGIMPDYIVKNVAEKFALPENYLPLTAEQIPLILPDGDKDAIMALEQRLNLINHLPDRFVDGIYDDNTDAAIKVLAIMRGNEEKGLTADLITFLDKTIEGYNGQSSYPEDNQLDFVMGLIMGKTPEQAAEYAQTKLLTPEEYTAEQAEQQK